MNYSQRPEVQNDLQMENTEIIFMITYLPYFFYNYSQRPKVQNDLHVGNTAKNWVSCGVKRLEVHEDHVCVQDNENYVGQLQG